MNPTNPQNQEREEKRIAALTSYDILDTPPDQSFDDLTAIAAHICDTPISLVSLLDPTRQWFKSHYGLDVTETPRELAFCNHAIAKPDELLVVRDSSRDDRFRENPLATGYPHVRFYAGAPLVTSEGAALGTLCVIDHKPRDLTPIQMSALGALARQVVAQLELRKQLREARDTEKALVQAKDAAECARTARGNFLSNMSHEIRTPLTAIIGFAEAASESGVTPGDQAMMLRTISDNGHHLLQLINDILDLSKIDSGTGANKLETIPVSPAALLEEVRALMSQRAAVKGLSLRLWHDWPLPSFIKGDPLRLKQVLLNLVGNSIKFTAQGSIEIFVSCDPAKEQLLLKVTDTGIGLTAEQCGRLFQAFEQADASTTRQYGGSGLGLAICRKLVERMGGEIGVTSVFGEGSTFTFSVPTGPLKNIAWDHSPTEAPFLEPVRNTSIKEELRGQILVVDDAIGNRQLIAHALKKTALDIVMANNGQEALDATLKASFDLILLDMQMPVMDGFEVARTLRRQGLTLPIIAFTANSMRHDVLKCLDAGCTAHLPKPFMRSDLLDMLHRHLAPARFLPDERASGRDRSAV